MQNSTRTHLRIFALTALCALALAALFGAIAYRIPAYARSLFDDDFALRVTEHNMPVLIAKKLKLEEARVRVDKWIADDKKGFPYRAWRGRLEAELEGPEAGYRYFVELFGEWDPQESIEPLAEFARLAALTKRWDDFFALAMALSDYGEEERVKAILDELPRIGLSPREAMLTPAGLRFLAHTGRDADAAKLLPEPSPEQSSWMKLWRAERGLRLGAAMMQPSLPPAAEFETLAKARMTDVRAQRLLELRHGIENRGAAGDPVLRDPPPLAMPPGYARMADAMAFTPKADEGEGGVFVDRAEHAVALAAGASRGAWLVAKGDPFLWVHPLAIVKLDSEAAVYYIPYSWDFPIWLERRDKGPFANVSIRLINHIQDDRVGLNPERRLRIGGVFANPETAPVPES